MNKSTPLNILWFLIPITLFCLSSASADSNDTNLVYFNDSLNVSLTGNTTIATTSTVELGENTMEFVVNLLLLVISIVWLICAFATSSFAMGLGAGTFGILTGIIWITSKADTMRNAMAITLILVSLLALWNIVSDMRKRKN